MLYYIIGREGEPKMIKQIDWKQKESKARGMTNKELQYAIKDCGDCVRCGIDGGYYLDEISIYRRELTRRENRKRSTPRKGRRVL